MALEMSESKYPKMVWSRKKNEGGEGWRREFIGQRWMSIRIRVDREGFGVLGLESRMILISRSRRGWPEALRWLENDCIKGGGREWGSSGSVQGE